MLNISHTNFLHELIVKQNTLIKNKNLLAIRSRELYPSTGDRRRVEKYPELIMIVFLELTTCLSKSESVSSNCTHSVAVSKQF